MEITPSQAPKLLSKVLKAKLVPMITGSPGLGKSAIVQQLAKEYNLKVIDLRLSQCDPTDLMGLPTICKKKNKAFYSPMDVFPLEGELLPKDEKGVEMNGWLLFLDEINAAPLSVQKASYKLILDRMIGQFNLHPNLVMVGAGNLSTDNAIVNQMSTASQSRLVHFQLVANIKEWTVWANENRIDHRIVAYVNFRPDKLHDFRPDHSDHTFACPRTWEFLSRMITDTPLLTYNDLPYMAGTIGEGVAREFLSYTQIYKDLISIEEIMANPHGVTISDEPSVRYALSGLVSHHFDATTGDALMPFIERLPMEFRALTLQGAIQRKPETLSLPIVDRWVNDNLDLFA